MAMFFYCHEYETMTDSKWWERFGLKFHLLKKAEEKRVSIKYNDMYR